MAQDVADPRNSPGLISGTSFFLCIFCSCLVFVCSVLLTDIDVGITL